MSKSSPDAPAQSCARCGAPVAGNFCSQCGTPIGDTSCPSCKTPLRAGIKFCHLCGAPVAAAQRRPAPSAAWFAAGTAVVAVVAVLVLVALRGPGATPPAAAAPSGPVATPSGGEASGVDLASLTPRERADRLYDRIMQAHERGDTTQVNFFKPMTLQAYGMLGGLDNDARYHIGLIHAVTGDPQAAIAQADSIEPGNLMAIMLRQRAAMALGDAEAGQQAYREFLASYQGEIATTKPEYEAHRTLLESFLSEARQATGSGAGS